MAHQFYMLEIIYAKCLCAAFCFILFIKHLNKIMLSYGILLSPYTLIPVIIFLSLSIGSQ